MRARPVSRASGTTKAGAIGRAWCSRAPLAARHTMARGSPSLGTKPRMQSPAWESNCRRRSAGVASNSATGRGRPGHRDAHRAGRCQYPGGTAPAPARPTRARQRESAHPTMQPSARLTSASRCGAAAATGGAQRDHSHSAIWARSLARHPRRRRGSPRHASLNGGSPVGDRAPHAGAPASARPSADAARDAAARREAARARAGGSGRGPGETAARRERARAAAAEINLRTS